MKPKVLIIGAQGFIGSFLSRNLSYDYDVYKIVKGSLDVLDLDVVYNFLKQNKFDIVVNCLTFGGKHQVNVIDETIVSDNLKLFNNFLLNSVIFTGKSSPTINNSFQNF